MSLQLKVFKKLHYSPAAAADHHLFEFNVCRYDHENHNSVNPVVNHHTSRIGTVPSSSTRLPVRNAATAPTLRTHNGHTADRLSSFLFDGIPLIAFACALVDSPQASAPHYPSLQSIVDQNTVSTCTVNDSATTSIRIPFR